ncbi:uncharacterized protein LOC132911378 [Bombus pascuorum]|uniref:uncharacterized protein LOC132911375 n=1 Tax=Bombus pascuorum TaxID=65598 RepID=UPI00298E550C|nr:uncharacterized protein LOC132911375 [Bombus pascuorum]XP_060823982.1 uncharacterized protein LOC132911378 [Bombus pascuorum]
MVNDCCASVGLTLAREKTEIMLITGMRVTRVIGINLSTSNIETVERIKYLGVTIDTYRTFDKPIETVWSRADKMARALRGILPNINGPPSLAPRLYYNVWVSIVTYGAAVWAGTAEIGKNRRMLKRA